MYSARMLGLLLLVGVSALVVLLKAREGFQVASSGPKCIPPGEMSVSAGDCCSGAGNSVPGGVVKCS